MIDGHFKSKLDKFWEVVARTMVALGFTPNQVTMMGLAGVLILSVLYPIVPLEPMTFGILLVAFFAFDSLDGAVARLTDTSSKYGGYLDAIADRYQEVAVFASLAYAHECWPVAYFAASGSLLVSYAKARTAIEIEIDNSSWPDLMERMERVIVLCGGLILSQFVTWPADWPGSFIAVLLLVMGVLTHFTAIQRFMRARKMLIESERND